jgi:carbonic anhydrase
MKRQWAESKDYKPPIPFKEMQKKGREREDGTVIVCMF